MGYSIQKTNITTNVCIKPNIHSALYCKRSVDHKIHHSPTPFPSNKHHSIPLHLQHMGDLATKNDLENTAAEQLKEDKKKSHVYNIKSNIIIRMKQTHMKLVQYLHACCFPQVPFTFKKAIKKGFLKSFPELTVELIQKYLPAALHQLRVT